MQDAHIIIFVIIIFTIIIIITISPRLSPVIIASRTTEMEPLSATGPRGPQPPSEHPEVDDVDLNI